MNRKIGMGAAWVNTGAVVCFAVSMLLGFNFGSYFSSMFIAFSFVPMMCAYAHFAEEKAKTAGLTAVAFGAVYVAVILLVYFAQVTVVRFGGLTDQAAAILDLGLFGLYFNYDLLGYGLMALATFFAGLTVRPADLADRWLRGLLLGHGIFFFSCLIMPILGIFQPGAPAWIGTAALEFWCAYFIPVGIFSARYFSKIEET